MKGNFYETIILFIGLKNELIHCEGDIPTHMMILNRKVKVFKEGVGSRAQIIRMLKPGEHFGYRAIITNQPHEHQRSGC